MLFYLSLSDKLHPLRMKKFMLLPRLLAVMILYKSLNMDTTLKQAMPEIDCLAEKNKGFLLPE